MALTKAQNEFFSKFVKNAVQNLLISAAAPQYAEAVRDASAEALEEVNLKALTEGLGAVFLERVDFATLKRVNKFLESEDYQKVNVASSEALNAVEDLLSEVLRAVADQVSEVVKPEETA